MTRSITMRRFALGKSLVVLAVVGSQLGATEDGCGGGSVLRDPGFDLWCGDQLCAWKLVRGDVRRVGTWHGGDSGVAFLGDDSAIQQLSPVNGNDGTCIKFSMIANVGSNTDVFLDIDVQADGTIDRRERIPTASWKPIEFQIVIEPPYDGIRFELSKQGSGDAVLAQIAAEMATDCDGLTRIDPGARPNGSACNAAADCASGLCGATGISAPGSGWFGTVCMGCNPHAPECGVGETCGLGDPLSNVLAVPVQCVPVAAHELAERCIVGDECATGVCSGATGSPGQCSSCASSQDCEGACGPSWFGTGPQVCRPGEGAGASGSPCGDPADCASNRCTGTDRKLCRDGRACASSANCPVEDGLVPGSCTRVGIQGGTCD